MFEPQVMENRNAMPAMEQESAASVTERGGCKSNLTNFRDQKGHAENKMLRWGKKETPKNMKNNPLLSCHNILR